MSLETLTEKSITAEMKSLLQWLGTPKRSPAQLNRLNESDCEIIQIGSEQYLATTVDSIADEITYGLYRDPYTMGWVTAQASLSDLAAVGVQPLGLLFSTQWASDLENDFKAKVSRGFQDALKTSNSFLLGGDSGTSKSTVLTSVGFGISHLNPVNRVGIKPGDYFCVSGQTGAGPALAFQLLQGETPDFTFRPVARVELGTKMVQLATAMMDTSDGLMSTLNTLCVVNQIGIELNWNPKTLNPQAVKYCEDRNIPLWMLWLGEHGDFELVVVVSPEQLDCALKTYPDLKMIGRATSDPKKRTLGIINKELNVAPCINSGYPVDLKSLSLRFAVWVEEFRRNGFP